MDAHESFLSNSEIECQPEFNKHIDSLGMNNAINSLLIVPIVSYSGNPTGAFAFVNSPTNFTEDDLHLINFLTLLPKELTVTEENYKSDN